MGGGFRGFGQCPKENVFFQLMSSLIVSQISTVKILNVGMESNPGPLFGKKIAHFFRLVRERTIATSFCALFRSFDCGLAKIYKIARPWCSFADENGFDEIGFSCQ